MSTRRLWMISSALALVACGGADAPPPRPPSPAPAPPAVAPAAASVPAPAAQVFAAADVDYAFRDPDRKKKLASAFPKIAEIAEDELRKQELPGLAVGVVIDGELAWSKGFGVTDLQTGATPDADTVYRIGSITKSFTAMTLLTLRDEGALSLDDPLTRWIPEAAGLVYPTHDSSPITLRQLLTHTSGLPRIGNFPQAASDRAPSEAEVLASLKGFALENAPGTHHVYSNLGFGLLGITVGRAARSSYRDAVDRRVLAPLGMTSTVWERARVPAGRLASAYTKGPGGKPAPIEHWLLGAEEGAGGLYSSVRDLARYVAFQLSAYPPRSGPETVPVKRSSVREAHFNALKSSLRIRLTEAPRQGESLVDASASRYGYAWVAEQTCEIDEVVWHNGGIDGYRTDIAFLPDHAVGLIALTNLGGSASPEAVVDRALIALHRSGGLSKRTAELPAVFEPVMKKLLAVYDTWDEATYASMLTTGRGVTAAEERRELEGYKALHGKCTGFTAIEVMSPLRARFKMECERGVFEMEIGLAADKLIAGFAGTSRDVPAPPDLARVGARVAGLIKKWDEAVYKKHLATTKRTHDETVKLFEDTRAAHGACTVKSMMNVVFDRKLVLDCERGGGLELQVALDPKNPDVVTGFSFRSPVRGTCPVR